MLDILFSIYEGICGLLDILESLYEKKSRFMKVVYSLIIAIFTVIYSLYIESMICLHGSISYLLTILVAFVAGLFSLLLLLAIYYLSAWLVKKMVKAIVKAMRE